MLRTPVEWATALRRHASVVSVSDLNGAVQITRGRYFWPLEPTHPANDYDIEFIAHVLSGDRRWGGVAVDANGDPSDYSVAQHLVHVADIVNLNRRKLVPGWDWDNNPAPTLYGLMHDATEAYLRDFPRPVKYLMKEYTPAENALMDEIVHQFHIPLDFAIREAVRRVDNMMIFLERDVLVGQPCVPYSNECDHPRISIHDVVPEFHVWDAKTAKRNFLDKFEEVVAHDGNRIPLNYLNRGYTL